MSWNAGYVTDLNYNYGYYSELNSVRANVTASALGLRSPRIRNACELGFGQGLSAAIHSAAQSDVTWWGTDFNPSQAAFVQELVQQASLSGRFFDQAFIEFCARDDLPNFEFIALHGIWSWISDENRRVLVDFIGRKLAVGGLLYISYNAQPGWSLAAPLRHLMKQHADRMGVPAGGMSRRIDGALEFIDLLLATNPLYCQVNPNVGDRFAGIKAHQREYLAHEYMNRDWRPMHFSEMVEWLEPAKIAFAGSLNPIEQQDSLNLTAEQVALLADITDTVLKETTRDFIINQQFRRDLWVKGPRRLPPLELGETHRQLRYILVSDPADVSDKIQGRQGEAVMNPQIYQPILTYMADHQTHTLAQIEEAVADKGVNFGQVINALGVLMGVGAVAPAQDDAAISAAAQSTERLNEVLMHKARSGSEIGHLASPVLGGGVPVSRFDQLFLLARKGGRASPAELAQYVAAILAAQGQKLIKDGRTLETPEDNVAELTMMAEGFNQKRLAVLKSLGIA